MKIGILGGTFDPIHNGHLMIGRYARDMFSLDEIWVMPNGNPPHKSENCIETKPCHRIEMARRAIANERVFVLQLYEVERKEINYSYLTMEHFREEYPMYEFFFILGADSLFSLERWVHPERLLKTCTVLAAFRDGKPTSEMKDMISYLNQKYDADIRLLYTPEVDVSSTEIRDALKEGRPVHDQIPQSVLEYIKENGLYRNVFDEICDDLSLRLTKERYEHTLGVALVAEELAKHYGEDVKKARMAGILHDCAKCMGKQELYKYCQSHAIPISVSEQANPELLHAKVGASVAKETYGILDESILNAIIYHTTGRTNMSLLEKILYVADYIEPNRCKAPNLDEIRHLAFVDLDECTCRISEATLAYLRAGNKCIDSATEETYLFYRQKLENEQKG